MSIANDYLDVDSVASKELLQPLVRAIHDNDMVVMSCKVDVCFETRQKTGFWQNETIKRDSVSRDFKKIGPSCQDASVKNLVKKLASIASLAEPEKDPALVSEVCALIREDLKISDAIAAFLTFANLSNEGSEIRQKLKLTKPAQIEDLLTSFKEKIQKSSDLELFQQAQSSFLGMRALLKEMSEDLKKNEFCHVSICYMRAMQAVKNAIFVPKQLTDIAVSVVLAKRDDQEKLTTGYCAISNKKAGEWIWN